MKGRRLLISDQNELNSFPGRGKNVPEARRGSKQDSETGFSWCLSEGWKTIHNRFFTKNNHISSYMPPNVSGLEVEMDKEPKLNFKLGTVPCSGDSFPAQLTPPTVTDGFQVSFEQI